MAGIFQKAIQAWRRFPVALLLAVVATVALTGSDWFRYHISSEDDWGHLLASWGMMGFCWIVCGHLWAERLPRLWQRLMVPLVMMAATALVWWLGYDTEESARRWDSLVVIGGVGFLCLLVLPLLTPTDGRSLRTRRWLYGLAKAIILSFLVALVLFIGLGIQFYLLEVLFSDYLRDYMFPLMIVCQMVVAPWCALALAPNLWWADEDLLPPTLAVKVLVRYVLGGLLFLYSVTLNIYCLYVLLSGQWPEGAIAGQVMALACLGGLVWTLLYAVQEDSSGRLEKLVLVGFWPGLLAPTVALFVACGLRIEQYGITEPRYYLLLGGVLTLLGIAGQVFRRRVPNPSVLAMLVVVALPLTLFGPWSAESVSVANQFQRLVQTLDRVGILGPDGKVNDQASGATDKADRDLLWNMVRFLTKHGADDRLQSLFRQPDVYPAAVAQENYHNRTSAFMELLPGPDKAPEFPHYDLVMLEDDAMLPVRGYDFVLPGSLRGEGRAFTTTVPFQKGMLRLKLREQGRIWIGFDDAEVAIFDLTPAVKAHLDQSPNCQCLSCSLSPFLVFDADLNDSAGLRLLVTGLRGTYIATPGDGTWREVERIDFVLLVKEAS